MKNIYALFTFFLIQTFSLSQVDVDKIIIELNSNLKLYSGDSKINKVYLNRNEKIIDIGEYLIPLENTEIIFEKESRVYNGIKIVGYVTFKRETNSINSGKEYISSVGFAFKSKDGAYKFIDLLFKLKKELEND